MSHVVNYKPARTVLTFRMVSNNFLLRLSVTLTAVLAYGRAVRNTAAWTSSRTFFLQPTM